MRVILVIAITLASLLSARATENVVSVAKSSYRGEVVLVRGGFGVFSRGLDAMAAELRRKGLRATVISYSQERRVVRDIVARQKTGGAKPVVLIGHSWGGNTVIDMARSLKAAKVRVDYAAVFAATNPDAVPSNVRKLTNYFFAKDGWGKPVRRGRGFRGRLTNVDVSGRPGVNHFNMDEDPGIQKQVLRNVLRYMRRGRSA